MGISNVSNGLRSGVCTSTTRPTAPYEGQMIYETDTDMVAIWNGSAWRYIAATTPTNGTVLQVVQGVYGSGQYSTSSTTFIDTNVSATITPKSSSSKILCIASQNGYSGSSGTKMEVQFLRGSTVIANVGLYGVDANNLDFHVSMTYLDSPSTTSSTTYKTQYRSTSGNLVYLGRNSVKETITLMEIAG